LKNEKIFGWILIGIGLILVSVCLIQKLNPAHAANENTVFADDQVVHLTRFQDKEREEAIVEIIVRPGWSLAEIAEGVGMNLEALMKLNSLTSLTVYPGQILKTVPYSDFDEVLVSWYGPGFHGKTMANGKIFNMYDPTIVAHKWLPFGTRVKLTRLDTGRSVVVIVQDRGPYIPGRHFDLSYAAAMELNMIKEGVVRCKVEILGIQPPD